MRKIFGEIEAGRVMDGLLQRNGEQQETDKKW